MSKEEKIKVSVMLPKSVQQLLMQESDKYGMTQSSYVEEAIKFHSVIKEANNQARKKGLFVL